MSNIESVCILVNSNVLMKLIGSLFTMKDEFNHFYLVVHNNDVINLIKMHPLFYKLKNKITFIVLDKLYTFSIDQILFSYKQISKKHKKCLFLLNPVIFLNRNHNLSFVNEKIAFLETRGINKNDVNTSSIEFTNQVMFVSDIEPLLVYKQYVDEYLCAIEPNGITIQDILKMISDKFCINNHINYNYYLGCYNFFQGELSATMDVLDASSISFFEMNESINASHIINKMKEIVNYIIEKYPSTMNYFLINNMQIHLPIKLKGIPYESNLTKIVERNMEHWYWNVNYDYTRYLKQYNDVIFLETTNINDLDNSIIGKRVYLTNYSQEVLDVLDVNNIKYEFFSYIADDIYSLTSYISDHSYNIPKSITVSEYDDIIGLKDVSYNQYLDRLGRCTYANLNKVDCAFISECIALGVIIVTKLDSLFALEKDKHYVETITDDVNVVELRQNLNAYYHQNLTEMALLKRMFTQCIVDGKEIS